MPSIESLARIELINSAGDIVASIENKPGKQGSLIIYQYLFQTFGTIDAKAAAHGLSVFAEHTADAKARLGAHPNIDHLLEGFQAFFLFGKELNLLGRAWVNKLFDNAPR